MSKARTLDPEQLGNYFLNHYPEFIELCSRRKEPRLDAPTTVVTPDDDTPDESLAKAYTRLESDFQGELLSQFKERYPASYEQLVVDGATESEVILRLLATEILRRLR